MNCQEVQEQLVAYLDGEVAPSEQVLIQAHLTGCDACQRELAALSATQRRVSRSLQIRAAQTAPSPQAWSRLQARLAGEARPSPPWLPTWLQRLAPGVGRITQIFTEGITMKRGFALAALAALVIAVSTVAFVPAVRAQVGEAIVRWFRIELPGGEVGFGVSEIGETLEFMSLQPTYLPAGFRYSSVMVSGGPKPFKLEFHSDEQFVAITQSKAPADKPLPAGKEVTVNGQRGVLVTGLKGTFEGGFRFRMPKEVIVRPKGTPPTEPIRIRGERVSIPYDDGKRLIWYAGDVKVEMLSNLSVEEMLKIAESMVPVEAGEGEAPFGPPLDLPSVSEGEPFIIQQGPIEYSP